MEMPDVQIIYTVDLGNDGILKMLTPPTECQHSKDTYYHSRIVEALRRENEELKAKLDKAKWQPIETAPEGKNVLVWYGGGIEIAWRYGEEWKMHTQKMQYKPTHWMPLPDAPEQR